MPQSADLEASILDSSDVNIIELVETGESSSEEFTSKSKSTPAARKARASNGYDPIVVRQLATEAPDTYWTQHADSGSDMIREISAERLLECRRDVNIYDQGPITGMSLSPDGTMLATYCNTGCVKVWDLEEMQLLRQLRDHEETHIDEFYVGQFIPDQPLLVTAGKRKNRSIWSEADDDNHVMSTPIKIFDVVTGQVLTQLHGHEEEVICLKLVRYRKDNYIVSTSQDGYIIKWRMTDDWRTLKEMTRMEDGVTCMAFTVSFVPDTGNRYFVAACDDGIKIYDFEAARLIQTFDTLYSSYCDCAKFVRCLDLPYDNTGKRPYAYLVTRGVELLDSEDCTIASEPNVVIRHRLVYPTTKGGLFRLTEEHRYQHEEYHSNSWLVKITSNGRSILAPTLNGQVFIFNIRSGEVQGVLKDCEEREMRDVLFHPTRPLIFTSSDDGTVRVYTQSKQASVVGTDGGASKETSGVSTGTATLAADTEELEVA